MQALSVEEAAQRLLHNVEHLDDELIPLDQAHNRIISKDIVAKMSQPPFPASAMDGYCVRADDFSNGIFFDAAHGAYCFKVVGASRAGHPFEGGVQPGETVRIFTGAEVPEPCDAIILQEDCTRTHDDTIVVKEGVASGTFVRPLGYDFSHGEVLAARGTKLTYRHLALIASMNVPEVRVRRRPRVAILATGDELVVPGQTLGPGQIVSSVPFGLSALIEAAGGQAHMLGIAQDNLGSLACMIEKARNFEDGAGFDVLVTIGGASVGDHDLVQQALGEAGMTLDFWKIAMRPGKPLMVGSLDKQRVVGLPGNPVSALICGCIFVVPLIKTMLGLPKVHPPLLKMSLQKAIGANGPRQHYMRAIIYMDDISNTQIMAIEDQDSSLQAHFSRSNALIVRPPHASPAQAGDEVEVIILDDI